MYIHIIVHFLQMFDRFKEMLRKICEGPYDNEIKPNLRLLYLTRPKMEKFARHMEAKIPSKSFRFICFQIFQNLCVTLFFKIHSAI